MTCHARVNNQTFFLNYFFTRSRYFVQKCKIKSAINFQTRFQAFLIILVAVIQDGNARTSEKR